MSEVDLGMPLRIETSWRLRRGFGWAGLALLASAVGCGTAIACGCSSTGSGKGETQDLVWRCTQSPALTLTAAFCACTGYEPGKQEDPSSVEVDVCDAKLPCCFVGPASKNGDGVVVGKRECRCVHDASCSAEMEKREGVTKVSMCPPSDG